MKSLEWQLAFLIIFSSLAVLLFAGVPVFAVFLLIDVVWGYILWGGMSGIGQLFLLTKETVQTFTLLPIPLFIILSIVLFGSGLGKQIIDSIDSWLGALPGRLAFLTVGSGTVLAALSGTSEASLAVLAQTLVPESEARGYKKPMSLGPALGSGGLSMMIPPSGAIVFLACLAQVSIGRLLIAGIFPGLLMATLYASYILVRCIYQPSIAPPYYAAPMPLSKKVLITAQNILPAAIIIFLVTGVIFLGIASPSEAAATGALGMFILAAAYRRLSWKVFKTSMSQALRVIIMMLSLVVGTVAFGQILAFSGITKGLVELIAGLPVPPLVVFGGMMVIGLVMGCFMSGLAIMLILIPLYMPIVHALGFDPIWFCVLFLLNQEMGLTSPPFGYFLFIMKGLAPPDTTMGDIYRAGLPFLGCDLIAMVLMIFIPQIVLWLPSIMISR